MTTYILGEGASLHAGYPLAGQLRGALYDWISNKKLKHDLYRTRIEIIRDAYGSNGYGFSLGIDAIPPSKTKILKLHGSTNW